MVNKVFPWKSRRINGRFLITNEAGDYFVTSPVEHENLVNGNISKKFGDFLKTKGFIYEMPRDLYCTAQQYKIQKRRYVPKKIQYILIVPTLRCDLSCSYCQVSRARKDAVGYDWTEKTLEQFLNFVKINAASNLKIEIQGGEPTLRLDLIEEIIKGVSDLRPNSTFVICTNLQTLSRRLLNILSNERVTVSTSLDGPPQIHQKARTGDKATTSQFYYNLATALKELGPERISALPTFSDFNAIEPAIDYYREIGLTEIFLRPVNFQGFARKKHKDTLTDEDDWITAYKRGLAYIFKTNFEGNKPIIETNFSLHLNRIVRTGENGHVDLRSPNPSGQDYLVVDFDGSFYPSDEARMLSRVGLIDLSVGSLDHGVDKQKLGIFNASQDNTADPVCMECTYQSYCGVDSIDKISRYGRVDHPTNESYFCRTHTAAFDEVFKHIVSREEKSFKNLSLHLTGKFELNPVFGYSHYD